MILLSDNHWNIWDITIMGFTIIGMFHIFPLHIHTYIIISYRLVGGLEHELYDFP